MKNILSKKVQYIVFKAVNLLLTKELVICLRTSCKARNAHFAEI